MPAPIKKTPKQIVQRYLKTMTNGKPGDLAAFVAPDVIAIEGEARVQGLAAAEAYAARYRAAIEGWRFQTCCFICEGPWVAVSGSSEGVARQKLIGIYEPGSKLAIPFMATYRVTRGKIAEVRILTGGGAAAKTLV